MECYASPSYQIDLLTFLQRHDGFLPPRPSPQRAPNASLLARVVTSVYVDDLLLEEALNGVLDLNLVRLRIDAENVFVLILAHQC